MNKTLAILLLGLIVCACAKSPDFSIEQFYAAHRDDGRRYIEILADEISSADQIVVTEHSFEFDAYDYNAKKSQIKSQIIYNSVELSPAQKMGFARTIRGLKPDIVSGASLCIFAPHHSIAFYRAGVQTSLMEICFDCDQVEWRRANYLPPESLFPALSALISGIGLQPERDWAKLAAEHVGK